jgi:hypothetical protein
MAITSTGAVATSSYLTSAYGRASYLGDTSSGSTTDSSGSSSSSSATVVTLSAAAQAKLAHSSTADLATVTADARAALDALYKSAKVSGPLQDGQLTVDLSSLDRRELYAVATNAGGKFSADEQKAASGELDARFKSVLSQQAAVARLTGDWSRIYKTAIEYQQGAGQEEKSSAAWKTQLAALQKGYASALVTPDTQPSGSSDDPVAAFLAGGDQSGSENLRSFSSVASDVRTALDAQKTAAADKGRELVFDSIRKSGQMVDLSGFDNRALSAVALNQGSQFSDQEVRAAKGELDSRTRASLLAAFKQSGASSDARALSVSLLSNYAQMSAEERQATNFTTTLRDEAVKNYRSASNLISMLQQASDGLGSLFG